MVTTSTNFISSSTTAAVVTTGGGGGVVDVGVGLGPLGPAAVAATMTMNGSSAATAASPSPMLTTTNNSTNNYISSSTPAAAVLTNGGGGVGLGPVVGLGPLGTMTPATTTTAAASNVPAPVTMTTMNGSTGPSVGGGGGGGQPIFINSSSNVQILNAVRASMQQQQQVRVPGPLGPLGNVQTVTTQGGTPTNKPLGQRMFLSPQMIGARPGQPGVRDCSSEFNKNDNHLKESSDSSNVDASNSKDSMQSEDESIPIRIEDADEPITSSTPPPPPPPELFPCPTSPIPVHVDADIEKSHSLQSESQSLVYPFDPKETHVEVDLSEPAEPTDDLFFCDPSNMASQVRFESDSGLSGDQYGSPVLNLDEHSHSDIIRFNPQTIEETAADSADCVQILDRNSNEEGQSESELILTRRKSTSLDLEENRNNPTTFEGILDVQMNQGLKSGSKLTVPNLPNQQLSPNSLQNAEGKGSQAKSPSDEDVDVELLEVSNQSRQSILVPNTTNVVAQSSSNNVLATHQNPTANSAQAIPWTRANSANTSEYQTHTFSRPEIQRSPEFSHPSHPYANPQYEHSGILGPGYHIPAIQPNPIPAQTSPTFKNQAGQGPRFDNAVRQNHPQATPTRFRPALQPLFEHISHPHQNILQFMRPSHPSTSRPQFSPTQPHHPNPTQFSPTSQPHSRPPQFSPNSQPHTTSQFSPTSHQVVIPPQFSPTSQPQTKSPQFSPTFQPHANPSHFLINSQHHPSAPQFTPPNQSQQNVVYSGVANRPPAARLPYSYQNSVISSQPRPGVAGHQFSAQPHVQRPLHSATSNHDPGFTSNSQQLHVKPAQHSPHFPPSSPHLTSPRQFSPTGETSRGFAPGPISPQQYKVQPGPPKCFTTDAQLQSQYLQYNQTHPITVQVNKSLSPPGPGYVVLKDGKSGVPYPPGPMPAGVLTRPPHPHPSTNFARLPVSPTGTAVHVQHASTNQSYPPNLGHGMPVVARSHPHAHHPYDLQTRPNRPNFQHSSSTLVAGAYNHPQQNNPRWGTHSLVRSSGPGPQRGISVPDGQLAQARFYTAADHSNRLANPNSANKVSSTLGSPTFVGSQSNSQGQVFMRYTSDSRMGQSNFSQGNVNSRIQYPTGVRGTVRPIAHQSLTYAQYSSQHRQPNDSTPIYYQNQSQGQGQNHSVPTNSQGQGVSGTSYPMICRVSPIRSRLESHSNQTMVKPTPPYPHQPYQKFPPPGHSNSIPSQEYSGHRVQGSSEYSSFYQHDQYNEMMSRLSTQFTLQALPGLPPGAQGGHHLLVKTESGQYQLVRFGMPAPALTATTGTPLPLSSPLTIPPNSNSPAPSSPIVVTSTTPVPAAAPPSSISSNSSFSAPLPTFAVTSTNSIVSSTVTVVGPTTPSVVVSQPHPPLLGPVSSVNFVSANNPPRHSSVVTSSSTSSTNSSTTVSNSSTPSQVSNGSPALAGTATTTTYRLQTVPQVPPTAASNSSGVGMTASMPMQQQMHLPQVMPHSQALSSQAPSSVLKSANTSSTATSANVSQMTPDTAKTKCKNFLTFLLDLSAKQNQTVARNVKSLIQGLLDGKVNAEDFSDRLQKEVNSQPQPCLVGFLKKSLPPLRHSLATKELTIEGIRPPVLSSLTSGVPPAPVTALIPQNQVRPPPVTSTPVRIITPVNSTPSPQPMTTTLPPIPRSTAAAVQQRFATPGKASPSSKAAKAAAANANSPTTQSHPPTPKSSGSSSKTAAKDKGDKKAFASNAGYSGDDDINDVAAMGGVNLAEESQRILGSTEMIGTQIRSCKDEAILPAVPLQSKIKAIAAKHGLGEPSPEVAAMISHALVERLKTILEKLSVIAEHRLDVIKLEEKYEVAQDVKGQLRFLEELDKLERKRHDEQEREMLIRAAKSRSKSEDPEQAKLKAKAKEMQRVALEEMRQREANLTALQAIGPRKKPKLDIASGSQSTTSQTPQSSAGASNSLNRTQMPMRPRLKRVSLRDLLFLMEQDKETTRSHFLYKHLLLK